MSWIRNFEGAPHPTPQISSWVMVLSDSGRLATNLKFDFRFAKPNALLFLAEHEPMICNIANAVNSKHYCNESGGVVMIPAAWVVIFPWFLQRVWRSSYDPFGLGDHFPLFCLQRFWRSNYYPLSAWVIFFLFPFVCKESGGIIMIRF